MPATLQLYEAQAEEVYDQLNAQPRTLMRSILNMKKSVHKCLSVVGGLSEGRKVKYISSHPILVLSAAFYLVFSAVVSTNFLCLFKSAVLCCMVSGLVCMLLHPHSSS